MRDLYRESRPRRRRHALLILRRNVLQYTSRGFLSLRARPLASLFRGHAARILRDPQRGAHGLSRPGVEATAAVTENEIRITADRTARGGSPPSREMYRDKSRRAGGSRGGAQSSE